jgi:hypothetical protein
LYSDLKEDWIANLPSNSLGFEFPFRTVGGDPIGSGLNVGSYFFLRNDLGWRLRADEVNHQLMISGNLYPENISLPMFVPTIGSYVVTLILERSQLTQSTGGSNNPWNYPTSGNESAGTMGERIKQIKNTTTLIPGLF